MRAASVDHMRAFDLARQRKVSRADSVGLLPAKIVVVDAGIVATVAMTCEAAGDVIGNRRDILKPSRAGQQRR